MGASLALLPSEGSDGKTDGRSAGRRVTCGGKNKNLIPGASRRLPILPITNRTPARTLSARRPDPDSCLFHRYLGSGRTVKRKGSEPTPPSADQRSSPTVC